GLGLVLATAFQAAGRPLWPLVGITSRAIVVAVGGWTALHLTSSEVGGLGGLAVAAGAGLAGYGASLAPAFGAGFWRSGGPAAADCIGRQQGLKNAFAKWR